MASNDLNCNELVELVTEYLEGTLSDAERTRFEEHLSICPGCKEFLKQMQDTLKAMGRLSKESVPDEALQPLLEAFRSWKKQ